MTMSLTLTTVSTSDSTVVSCPAFINTNASSGLVVLVTVRQLVRVGAGTRWGGGGLCGGGGGGGGDLALHVVAAVSWRGHHVAQWWQRRVGVTSKKKKYQGKIAFH